MKIENSAMEGGSAIKLEISVLSGLQHETVFPKYITGGRKARFHYLVLELLGENLKMLKARSAKNDSWPDGTWSRLGIQCLFAVKKMHDNGFVHRDIKPNNFAMGLNTSTVHSRSRTVLLFDFGLAREFVRIDKHADGATPPPARGGGGGGCPKTATSKRSKRNRFSGLLSREKFQPRVLQAPKASSVRVGLENDGSKELAVTFRVARPHTDFRGTFQYASPNAHMQKELGRADDVWSLMFMIAEMFVELPWTSEEIVPVEVVKNQVSLRRIFTADTRHPNRFNRQQEAQLEQIEKMLYECNYYSHPNYELVHQFLYGVMQTQKGVTWETPYDWEPVKVGDDSTKGRKKSKTAELWQEPGEFWKTDKWAVLKAPGSVSSQKTKRVPLLIPPPRKKQMSRESISVEKHTDSCDPVSAAKSTAKGVWVPPKTSREKH
uniref:Protein kinase domain-containing protein n=1 Tax=Caenorhabditis japonica TaxID=281687 RepID=A0A8R1DL38_CAEJA